METRRYINVKTWGESWFESLSAAEKLVWIYLNTNSATNMLGVYSTSIRRIAYECHISEPAARRNIKNLEVLKKLIYVNGYIIIVDWMAQQAMNPSMRIAARKEYDKLPEEIRCRLSKQTHEAIENTRQLTEHDGHHLPTPSPTFEQEKEEEQEGYEQEQETTKQEQETERSKQQHSFAPVNEICRKAIQNTKWIQALCHNYVLSQQELEEWLELFCRKLHNEGTVRKSIDDFRRHFASWLAIQLNICNHSKTMHHENTPTRPACNDTRRSNDSYVATKLNAILQSEASQRIQQLRAQGTLPALPDAD